MSRRFVVPEVVRLSLSGGDWVDVKKHLNIRETRNILTRQMKTVTFGEKPTLDPEQVGLAKVAVYLLGWGGPGFTDEAGRVIPYNESALDNLDAATFGEIYQAVEAHETRMEQERDAAKNPSGEIVSSAISPSAA